MKPTPTAPAASSQPTGLPATGLFSRTAGYFVTFSILGLGASILGPTLPYLAEHTGTEIGAISILFTARSAGYMLGSLQGGRLYDRLPGHRLLALFLIGLGIILAFVPMAQRLWLLFLALFLIGVGQGTLDLGANLMLVWTYRERVTPFMNGLHFFFGLGSSFAPVFVAQSLLRSREIHAAYWLLALLTLPAAVWLARLPSPVQSAQARHAQSARPNRLLAGLITAFFLLYVGAEVSFGGWVSTYALEWFGAGLQGETARLFAARAAYLTSTFWVAITIGRLLSVPLSARLRPRFVLAAWLAGSLISMSLIVLAPGSLLALQVGAAGLGLSMAPLFPTMMSFAGRHLPLSGRLTSVFLIGAGAGAMLLPWLLGPVFQRLGPQTIMPLILSDLLLLAAVFGIIFRLTSKEN